MIWSAAGAGFLQSLFFVGIPKKVSAVLYVAMGWIAARYSKVSTPQAKSRRLYLKNHIRQVHIEGLKPCCSCAYVLRWPELKIEEQDYTV